MTSVCGVDCDRGRVLGCKSYCCRLLVRLAPDEMEPGKNGMPAKGFVDKDEDGYCIHFNRQNCLCGIWHKRPAVCKAYDCNNDDLLQVAISRAFNNIVDLVMLAETLTVPEDSRVLVPYTDDV